MDVGYGRVCMHPTTGFVLALVRHPGAYGGAFDELRTGVDHLGLAAQTREELEEWERRFDEHGVTYTPIRDMEMGYHLNFRDPDDIASRAWSSATGPGLDGPKRDRLVGTGQVGASTRRHFVPRPAVRWVGRRRQRGHVERPAGSGISLR